MNEGIFAVAPPVETEEEREKKKKSRKGEVVEGALLRKSKKKKKKSSEHGERRISEHGERRINENGGTRKSSSSSNKKKKRRKSESRRRERSSSRHRESEGSRREFKGDTILFNDQTDQGFQNEDDSGRRRSTVVPNLAELAGSFSNIDVEEPLKKPPPTSKTSMEQHIELIKRREQRKKESMRQIIADDTISRDSTIDYAAMSRGSSKNSLTMSLEQDKAWPSRNHQQDGNPGAALSVSSRNLRNVKLSGMWQASGANSYGSSRVGAVSMTGGPQNGKRGPSVAPSSESYEKRQRSGAMPVANAAPRGKGSSQLRNNSSRVGAISVPNAAPQRKGGPSMSFRSDEYGDQASRVGAVSVSSVASQSKSGPSMSPSSDRYCDQLSRRGAVSVSSAAPRSKGGASSRGSVNSDPRVGATAVANPAPQGKGGSADNMPSLVSSSDGYGDQASHVGAVSVSNAVPRVKRGSYFRGNAISNPRVGATEVASPAPQGKRGLTGSNLSSRIGAVLVNSAAPKGKGSRPSIASSAESYELSSSRVGAMAVASAASKGKAGPRSVNCDSRVGTTAVTSASPQGKQSLYNSRSSSSSTVGTIGAVSVNSAAPKGKCGPSVASSGEHYDDVSQLGAFSVSSAAPEGKNRYRCNSGSGSVTSRDSQIGAVSVTSGASSRMAKGSGPSLRKGIEDYSAELSHRKSGSVRNTARSIQSDESATSHRGSVDTSVSSQKDRVSHFPTSDLYASISSLHDGTSTENKGRISQFPAEDQYEEEFELHSTRKVKRVPVPPRSSEKEIDPGPAYSINEESYGTQADIRTDRSETSDSLFRDRSVRSGVPGGSQSSERRGPSAEPRRRSTGAFFISEGTVEGREAGALTSNCESLPEAEVTPLTPFPDPEAPAPGNVQGISSADLKIKPFYCSRWFIIVMALLAVGGTVGAILGILIFGGDDSDSGDGPVSPTPSPIKPLDSERQAAIRTVLVKMTDTDTLDDRTSPQFAAYDWIVRDDLLSPLNPNGATTEEREKILCRYSLAVFYFATNGEKWFSADGWLDGERDECEWDFLKCENPLAPNQVDKINTAESRENGNNVLGVIPSEIRELSSLVEIRLPSNKIKEMHPDMGSLSNLEKLDLSTNQLEGPFPDFIYGMTSLRVLDLRRNFLTGTVSTSMSALSNLEQLILRFNSMSGTLTTELAGLQSLRELNLAYNGFGGDFHTIVEGLRKLVFLVLESNQIGGQLNGPKLLMGHPELKDLTLGINKMTGTIPLELGSLPDLVQVILDNNKLTGTIPAALADGAPLRNLFLEFNHLEGDVSQSLCTIPSLQIIRVDANIPCECASCAR